MKDGLTQLGKWMSIDEGTRFGSAVTLVWVVYTLDGNIRLGQIKWHTGWRRYSFIPASYTVFESDCMRTLADFCDAQTALRKAQAKAEKEKRNAQD